ncbi:MAG: methyltransferase family protein, partial [Candidatus Hodarchaeota archaeon]
MNMRLIERLKTYILKVGGYVIPFIQSIPPLSVWTGLMTVPVISYLIFFVLSFPGSITGVFESFFRWYSWFWGVIVIISLPLLGYSIFYQSFKKKEGLVTTGPYKWVRHPQYLIIILLTMVLTIWSYWVLTHTDGIGFLDPFATIILWFAELFAYVLLAKIEELYLSKSFGASYDAYKNSVPFLIPLLKIQREEVEIVASIVLLAFFLFTLIIVVQTSLY